ncbi:MAG: hypothetical protein CMJ76_13615 [Planctomycetaceae bacterium]|nr:hypothetical protein [Planctomycetaceae bacterium]
MLNRRTLLKTLSASSLTLLTPPLPGAPRRKVLRVAGIGTQYFRLSHCDVIFTKIMEGWDHLGLNGPQLELVSMYVEQKTENDISVAKSKTNNVPIYDSIEEALTCGTDKLKCDAVLSIAEHGNYEVDPTTHQRKYPRRRFFDAIADVFEKTGKVVPVFNDKHLSWNWRDAKAMYDRARKMKIPMQAGSSLPFTWRYPNTIIPVGAKIKTVTGVAFGGLESYGFHALETIQCLMERRQGGETGIKSVQAYPYEQMWEAEKAGRWNREAVVTALQAAGKSADNLEERLRTEDSSIYVIDYLDGTKAVCCMFNGITDEMSVAVEFENNKKLLGQWFKMELVYPFRHFEQLVRGIDDFFHSGKENTPLERTLLTTGILNRAVSSHFAGGKKYITPELAIQYRPGKWHFANQFEENFPEPVEY